MKQKLRLLIVDDEDSVRSVLRSRFERRGHELVEAADGQSALDAIKDFDAQVAICDLRMPGLDGFEVLKALKIPTILITGHGDKESAIRAVEEGAFAFFEKPFDLDALEISVQRAAEKKRLEDERNELLKKLDYLCRLQKREIEILDRPGEQSHFVGESPQMMEIREVLKRLALKPKASLLILGETGTGKELIARELHRLTYPKQERYPFLALNCASIPTELFESELYGHEKGSFSGAQNARIGLAEAVRDGTLFLDEIGEMDPRHQAKLLRFLQERVFRRVGSNSDIAFQGRVIAATHRNLQERSQKGDFREDLFYRISVVSVEIPPLRERGEDIALIAKALCERHGLRDLSPESLAELRSYNWPGNIRELNNWIERASILGLHDDENFLIAPLPHLNRSQGTAEISILPGVESEAKNIKELRAELLETYDRKWICAALERNRGNISKAAQELGLDRKNLAKRMKDLGLDVKKAA